jgi:hypothetical protein
MILGSPRYFCHLLAQANTIYIHKVEQRMIHNNCAISVAAQIDRKMMKTLFIVYAAGNQGASGSRLSMQYYS